MKSFDIIVYTKTVFFFKISHALGGFWSRQPHLGCDIQRLGVLCGNKMPTRCNRRIFIADIIAYSACFGHHYAHYQELESIIQVVAACRIWCLVFKLSVWRGAEGCVSGLRAAALQLHTIPTTWKPSTKYDRQQPLV